MCVVFFFFTRKNFIEKIQQKAQYNIVITVVFRYGIYIIYNYNNNINNESLEKLIIVIDNK